MDFLLLGCQFFGFQWLEAFHLSLALRLEFGNGTQAMAPLERPSDDIGRAVSASLLV
jgi:hypothetical protein